MELLSWPFVVRLPITVHSAVSAAPLLTSVPGSAHPSRLQKFRVTVERYAGVSSRMAVAPLVTRLSTVSVARAGGPLGGMTGGSADGGGGAGAGPVQSDTAKSVLWLNGPPQGSPFMNVFAAA